MQPPQNINEKPTPSVSQKVEALLTNMSIEEKAGQMTQVALDLLLEGEMYKPESPHRFDTKKLNTAFQKYKVGSVLNIAGQPYTRARWIEIIAKIQSAALAQPNKIPVLYGIDAIHGTNFTLGATLFPQPIGMAASWNPTLVEKAAEITAYETRASGIPWNFSPALDVSRTSLWPRLWESFGEDVLLNTVLGKAMVNGYQGKNLKDKTKVAACLKHFLGYGMPLSGKDRTPAWIPERYLREYYIPPFQAAIKNGAASIMVNSSEINVITVHASKLLLTDILRKELNFKGLLVTDWEDIKFLHTRHKVAETPKHAVKIAIEAGIDMSMVPDDYSFTELLVELVNEGTIPEQRLDESVRRILKLKYDLGLFDQANTASDFSYPEFASKASRKVALELARESITLLKNDGQQLPLKKNQKILVIGPTANSIKALNGGWTCTWQGDQSDEFITNRPTILQAIENRIGSENVFHIPSTSEETAAQISEILANNSDIQHILLCLGEQPYTEFFGNIDDLDLPEEQVALAKAAIATGKPLTLILVQGRPRIITSLEKDIKSILLAYLPGNEGADAIADIVFGDYNPNGKLPYTYPRHSNALITYDRKQSDDISMKGEPISYNPLFEFGTGQSYTQFEYSSLKLDKTVSTQSDELNIQVTVSNTGKVAGKEVVQLYVKDHYASITPPAKRLKSFKKISLPAGKSETVHFQIKAKDLEFVGQENQWISEAGKFSVLVGNLGEDFQLISNQNLEVKI